jgi:PilZ domain
MFERRQFSRTRLLKSGKIHLGKHEVPCTVYNLSETGAKLQVQTTEGLPSEFIFSMPERPPRPCEVIWRDYAKLGIRFK